MELLKSLLTYFCLLINLPDHFCFLLNANTMQISEAQTHFKGLYLAGSFLWSQAQAVQQTELGNASFNLKSYGDRFFSTVAPRL